MPEYNPYVLWLAAHRVPRVGPIRLRQLWQQHQSIQKMWGSLSLPVGQSEQHLQQAEQEYRLARKKGINILTIDNKDYPQRLIKLSDAPLLLYTRGQLETLNLTSLAVVGSRKANQYGSEVTQLLVKQLVAQNTIINSGMANGIDIIAHQSALDYGGRTIAVLGYGLDMADTFGNHRLAERIANNGLVVSQFPLGTPPQRFTFPARNRLLAGLSLAVIVTQAGLRSGSLLTATAAQQYQRPVYAVPGSIFNSGSLGTHLLLSQGARLAVDGADIVKTLTGASDHIAVSSCQPSSLLLTAPEDHIFHLLQAGPLAIDQLIRATSHPAAEVLAIVSQLEIKGIISCSDGEYHLRR